SLQAHPDAAQAREGFDRENAIGLAVDSPQRNYKDPFPKPELIVAVSERFEALSGFRPVAESLADLARLAAGSAQLDAALAPLRDRLVDDARVGDAFIWLLEGSGEAWAVVGALEAALREAPAELGHLARIAARHPGDPGIAGALL